MEFSEVPEGQGLHVGRVMKYLYHLRVCAENVTRLSGCSSLKAADSRAIIKLVAWLNETPRYKARDAEGLRRRAEEVLPVAEGPDRGVPEVGTDGKSYFVKTEVGQKLHEILKRHDYLGPLFWDLSRNRRRRK